MLTLIKASSTRCFKIITRRHARGEKPESRKAEEGQGYELL